ncbi:MAG: toxic anion resistance protein [Adlercreutzia sp.]|nr:toxic anion resistance protein [Adlercreutzia sp.]
MVDIETLKATNENLIQTFDEVMKIQAEGRAKRAEAEAEMRRMEAELRQKLLEVK